MEAKPPHLQGGQGSLQHGAGGVSGHLDGLLDHRGSDLHSPLHHGSSNVIALWTAWFSGVFSVSVGAA